MSSKKACFEWAPPARLGADDKIQWEAARTNLAHQIKDPGIGQKANTKRAEHLLRMIDAIAGDDVLESWRNDQSILPERLQRSQSNPAADAIYRLISRGQSRSFRDNAVLRVGKYLFASRVLNKVNLLRSLGPPSKQPVAIAGSTGEGNAVTRALKDFVREIHPETNQEGEACEVRKCLKSYERQPFVDLIKELRPDLREFVRTVEEELNVIDSAIAELLGHP
ncbi:MAG: hypothetical protein L6R42_000323 [Xanthoria sp. 1 TBL-2021]|nr:MAG: hypothetical protein L6R42_000323 [Xanthoria sp. 1 TBL-2021]